MKSQYEHSIRTYDGAHLVWRRDLLPGQIEFGFWYLVKVSDG